jgi:ribosomal protein S18 acetylase RimI-like enzyme
MNQQRQVFYNTEPDLAPAEYTRVLRESGLGAHWPIGDTSRLASMLAGASLIVTARLEQPLGPLVGVARCITDFAWCAYLSELAVCSSAQGLRIGQGLLDYARDQLGPQVSLIVISFPEAVGFYEHLGIERVADAFWYRRER